MSGAPPRTTPSPVASLVEHIAHFQRRVLQDALTDATAAYWHRRTETFLAARPRPGDFHGNATREQLRDQWHRLTEIANACRARAQVSQLDDLAPEIQAVLREAA